MITANIRLSRIMSRKQNTTKKQTQEKNATIAICIVRSSGVD